jgi:phosphoribosyl-ATP pyrophosphohydrolase/phosphoribosyl-AMP cyclohydrolase/histidinol dehydrogenase
MTAVTARTAGVESVWVASPRPGDVTLAAAALAGADSLLAAGGAQAIAALAFGAGPVPACDAVVGPGNRWVTAAKQLVAGRVAIDMLAGPSELVVLADASADPEVVAADLLAQAEHDPDAFAALVTTESSLASDVESALGRQLSTLPTAETARAALEHAICVIVPSLSEGARICDRLAPEHLEVQVAAPLKLAEELHHYGALFLGSGSAEVLGDYGAGPNHVLPTGGTARHSGGLSVLTFLRVRTWMRTEAGPFLPLLRDATDLARLEGLEAHARAAEARQSGPGRTNRI